MINGLETLGGSPLKPLRASSEIWIFGGLESLEAGSDECLEDRVPGRLHLSYSTRSGGFWERQIPTTECTGWVPFKTLCASSEVWRVWRLEVTNVSRIVSLGGSIYCILRVSEGPGSSRFRVAVGPGGSPLKPLLARLRRFGESGGWK